MKIGIAIPAYVGHINKLFDLLDSIEKQTRLPDKVVVSCSSTSSFTNNKDYSFPLEIILISEKNNASKNRNIAISRLTDMDYVTFIDADDIMHPQRIQILLTVFEAYNSDIILHSYVDNKCEFQTFERINVRINSLVRCHTGCIRHLDFQYINVEFIHHGHVTVNRHVLDKIKFPEEHEFLTKEDCAFCYRVFGLENIQSAYIAHGLTLYEPSNTGGFMV